MRDIDLAEARTEAMRQAETQFLLGQSAHLYEEILAAIRESIRRDGSGDLIAFAQRVNAALVGFAPHHRSIRSVLNEAGLDRI